MTPGDHASHQARFSAREFLAQWVRETGEVLSPTATDRLLFFFEVGYLRGRSAAAEEAMKMFDDVARSREEARKENDDDESK